MKLNTSKMALCLLVASAATSSIMAHAEPSFSTPDKKDIDLVFSAPAKATTLTLTSYNNDPIAGVEAQGGVKLFKAVNASNGGSVRLGIGYTQNLLYQTDLNNNNETASSYATLHGRNVDSNRMKIVFNGTVSSAWEKVNGQSFFVSKASATSQTVDIALNGKQTLNADSYTASMDGVQFIP